MPDSARRTCSPCTPLTARAGTPDVPIRQLVVEHDGRAAGWASYGDTREADAPGPGELCRTYAHPDAWSTGVGHALITAAEDALRSDGHETAYLWALSFILRIREF
ncbi:N-acetyltransferase family protein [Microbacterium sp. NPDC055521]